ncbi:MAG: type II secretion system protein, partial [Proteobacteria bacterium]
MLIQTPSAINRLRRKSAEHHSMSTRNKNGFTLLEFLASLGVVVILGSGVAAISTAFSKSSQNTAAVTSAMSIQMALMAKIQSTDAWAKTVQNNADMACLANKTDCSGATGGTFALYSEDGTVFYDSKSSTQNGFNLDAQQCGTFSPTAGLDCPFRYELTWKPVCGATGPCPNPLITVSGNLQLASSLKSMNLSAKTYSFNTFRSFAMNSR